VANSIHHEKKSLLAAGMNLKWLNNQRACIILSLVCLLCYGNTIRNDYSFDDNIAVTGNPYIPNGFKGIPDLLTNPYRSIGALNMDYRPIAGITFAIEHQFFGGNPHISHLVNVLLFVVLALIIYRVLGEVFQLGKLNSALPLIITLFYVVHPANTETVASIKNREQILSMIFALAALAYSYKYFFSSGKRLLFALAAIFFISLSFMSKMVLSIPIAGVILLVLTFNGIPKKQKSIFIFIALIIMLSAVSLSVNIWLSDRKPVFIENPLAENENLFLAIGFIFKTLLFYLKFIFFPYPFRFYYGYDMVPLVPIHLPLVLFSAALHVSMFIGGIFLFYRKHLLGLFLLTYLFNISFYSNIFPIPGIVAERSLFIAQLWLIAAVFILIHQLILLLEDSVYKVGFCKLALLAGIIVFSASVALTIHRNFQWKNIETLMISDMPHLKKSALANYLYAKLRYLDYGKSLKQSNKWVLSESKNHFKQVTQILPSYDDPYFRLGMIYEYDNQNRDSAFYYFKMAHEKNSASNTTRFQLAKQYFLKGNLEEAATLFELVYRELPQDTMTLFFYAQVMFNAQDKEAALKINSELMKLSPQAYYPYYNFGMIYYFSGQQERAVWYFEKTMEMGYSDNQIKNILLNYYLANNFQEKAEQLSFR